MIDALAPLARHLTVLLTLAYVGEETDGPVFRVTATAVAKDDADNPLSEPLILEGSPAELDESLPTLLTGFSTHKLDLRTALAEMQARETEAIQKKKDTKSTKTTSRFVPPAKKDGEAATTPASAPAAQAAKKEEEQQPDLLSMMGD